VKLDLLLTDALPARELNARVAQCTTRVGNVESEAIFKKHRYIPHRHVRESTKRQFPYGCTKKFLQGHRTDTHSHQKITSFAFRTDLHEIVITFLPLQITLKAAVSFLEGPGFPRTLLSLQRITKIAF
jgi:G3E family GTPase